MSPQDVQEVRATNHADAVLSVCGIAALTFLSYVHPDWSATYIIAGISCLAMRATGVVINAAKLAGLSKMAAAVEELNK